ncbi:uncharacterized protein LOC121376433 [Gigantopelta aegis]|uniref:uncharacterized protein LOC121376433 n=1 Tax=Gigantopelta aegis TaxID=1735272 RepID=UPI001B88D8B3|nr:uncharacterized protein LOC121376433 [Gigantopelta aegis]
MAGKFGVLSFIQSTKDNDRRFRTNIDAIIERYGNPDPSDDIIDLQSFQILSNRGSLENHKTCCFGLSKLATTQRREQYQTRNSNNCDGKTPESICESFLDDELDASVAEENCTKIFSFICVEENDPSDAETLSSCSTQSDISWEDLNNGLSQTSDELEDGQNLQESDGDVVVSKSWYSLRKSTSISSSNSVASVSGIKTLSTINKPDCLPMEKTIASKTNKVVIRKKLKLKKSESFDQSPGLKKLGSDSLLLNGEYCTSSVKDSVEYEGSSEDSAFEPCHEDSPHLSYKADIVRAWVHDQLENHQNTELCDTGLYSSHFTLGGVASARIKKEVPDESEDNGAVRMSVTSKLNSSTDSGATYIIPVNEPMDCNNNNSNLSDRFPNICEKNKVVMHSEPVCSPQKHSMISDDVTVCVKKYLPCSASRRILRARKRFKCKPPLVSMTEQQLQEFFDSPCPDFTLFYPTLACDTSKDSVSEVNSITGYKILSEGEIKCEKFEGNVLNASDTDSNREVMTALETRPAPTNYVSSQPPRRETSLKPTKLEFSTISAKNKLRPTSSTALSAYGNGDEHDTTLKQIPADATFLVNASEVTPLKRLENMLEKKKIHGSVKQMLNQMKQYVPLVMSNQPCNRILSVNAQDSDQDDSSVINNLTVVSDNEQSCNDMVSTGSGQSWSTIKDKKRIYKQCERTSVNMSQKPLEMSPVSRLSSLRLSSPIPSTKMRVVSSTRKNKGTYKHLHDESKSDGVLLTPENSSRIRISSVFPSCPKYTTAADVSPSSQKTRKVNNSQLENATANPHKEQMYSDRSPNCQQTPASNFSYKMPKSNGAVVSSNSKCSKAIGSSEYRLLNSPKDTDLPSRCSEHWHQMNRITKDNVNGLLNFPSNFEHSIVHANLIKRGLMQKNVHIKRLQKQTSTPLKRHIASVKRTRFCLNDTLSTIAANVDVAVIEPYDDGDQIITLSP